MKLEVDIGNTRAKWRLRSEVEVVARGVIAHVDGSSAGSADIDMLWQQIELPEGVSIASVSVVSVACGTWLESLQRYCKKTWGLAVKRARVTAQAAGVICAYEDYSRLGVDRWLAILAARHRSAGAHLVVDCGSAVTVDLLAANGQHLGGYIVPGLRLMRRALFQDTDAVKVAAADVVADCSPGQDTQTAVNHGLPLMVAGLVEQALVRLRGLSGGRVQVWITGGDAEGLQSLMPEEAVYCQDLVLDGLAFCEYSKD